MKPVVERIEAYVGKPDSEAVKIIRPVLELLAQIESSLSTHAEALVLLNQVDDVRAGQIRVLRQRLDALEARL